MKSKKQEGDIYITDVNSVTSLSIQDNAVHDLTGIEYFTGLRILIVGAARVNNLKPLAGLTNFENQVKDLSPLSVFKCYHAFLFEITRFRT